MKSRRNFESFGIIFFSICLIYYSRFVNSTEEEYFSSTTGLDNLLKTEVRLLAELESYVETVSNHIEALKSEISAIKVEHNFAAQDLENYLNNPVNAYRLIKRLQSDWPTFEQSIKTDASTENYLEALKAHQQNLSFPTQTDVYNAALGLVRLQDTYQLDVSHLASGILNGVKYGSEMSWQDCFLLGHQLYELRDFNHTVPWLKQSMKLLAEQEYNEDPISLDFMVTVAVYHQEMGDFESALGLVKHVLSVDPQREQLLETKAYLEEMIANGIKKGLLHEHPAAQFDYHQTNEFKLYEKVCRGEVSITPTQQRPLRCSYHTNNVPYRTLHPFKMEELYLDPYVVQFHDVISERQVNTLKALASPQLRRSRVRSLNGTNEVVAQYRTSKSAWFDYITHEYMERMRSHVADFSGLNKQATEDLQVANYGIGGHYEPHWDFFTDNSSFHTDDGNRLATAIFYLSDVEEGGGTAFPFLPLLVRPEQGSVLFWYNLHRSEEPDYRTRHAACPVLKGSKWIANIWVRVRSQEFRRRCGLERDHEISLKFKEFD